VHSFPLAQGEAPHPGELVDLRNQPQQQFMGRLHRLRRGVFHALPPQKKAPALRAGMQREKDQRAKG
jgi:hypothetical protein